MEMKAGDRVYDKKSLRHGVVERAIGMLYVKFDDSDEGEWRFPYEVELEVFSRNDSCGSANVKITRCKDCELWNTLDKQGELCSCAHFTVDDFRPAYTKPDDFCSYAEKMSSRRIWL